MSHESNSGPSTLAGRFSSAGHLSEPTFPDPTSPATGRGASAHDLASSIPTSLPLAGGVTGTSSGRGAQDQSTRLLFQRELVVRCEETVEKFKDGSITHIQAVASIAATLSESDDPERSEAALKSFTDQLDSFSTSLKQAADRGQTSSSKRRINGGSPDDPEPSDDGHEPSSKKGKNADSDESEPEEVGGQVNPESKKPQKQNQSRSSKKQLIFEHELPWFPIDVLARAGLHPDLQKTQDTIALFSRDFAAAKRFVTSSTSVPEFPDSEWDNVIRGRPINLDTVFASINAVAPLFEHSERLGQYEIKFAGGSVRASSKKIQTHGEWLMAWSLTERAICHAFPHRLQELQTYGHFITRQFGAIIPAEAMRVISLDESIRTFVGSRNNLLLTDYNAFEHLKTTFLSSFGTQSFNSNTYSKASGPKRSTTEKSPDICNKYNSLVGCGYSSGRCKYQHRCRKCRRLGHAISDCTQPPL